MIKRILIANRGEIALRIIRCCRVLDIETLLVYSSADADSLPVQLAQYAVCIGSPLPKDSYLRMDTIIETALKNGCDAIHPGYGFLSENAEFARKCEENGLVFIGPSAELIEMLGDKQSARDLMKKNKVPTVPGSDGLIKDAKEAAKIAKKIGYPVLIKASGGGGGRGMRRAYSENEIENAFDEARAEALSTCGNGDMYMEKLIINPHHIEFQILGDKMGNVIELGDRDCSIQRRNQKMVEESPSKFISEKTRKKMAKAALRAAKAAGYYSAGTVEFVVDDKENFYFIEMNTRIQVEHPVTEAITGVDIVKEQIRIAEGLALSYKQEDVKKTGHAIEFRINAENPFNNFSPSPGEIKYLHLPDGIGIRVETMLYQGYTVSPYYDSLVAKIIAYAPKRLEAIKRMRAALEEMMVEGVDTNIEFLFLLTFNPEFIKGSYDTSFMEKNTKGLLEWNLAGRKAAEEAEKSLEKEAG
ncbi:MAG: acetyl-CoA carboxylase biotin carboxylase subunit [Eubacterium sp.]|nr:acetyl-CoA carboxylase biotin carboxylase subunit [Eubacterium sp.]